MLCIPILRGPAQSRQSAKLFLQSSALGPLPPTPHPQASVPPSFCTGGRGTLAGERGVGRVPIPTRGHTLWCSSSIRTLWGPALQCFFPPSVLLDSDRGVVYLGALDEVNWSHALLRLLLQQELQGGAGSLTASWVRHKMLNCLSFSYLFRAEQLLICTFKYERFLRNVNATSLYA